MDESPMPPRTPCRSRYSSYQSDYETAAEDSDGSLYYSMLDEEEKENDSDDAGTHQMTPLSNRRTLLEKCLEKNLNLTPRNAFNKRFACNVNPFPSSSRDSPMAFDRGIGLQQTLCGTDGEARKRSRREEPSNLQISNSTTENITELVEPLDRSTENDRNISDVEIGEEDLNNTIVETVSSAMETISETEVTTNESIEEEARAGATGVSSTEPVVIHLRTTNIPCGPKRFGPAPNTLGLSNLPIPTKISIADLANPPAVTTNSHIQPSNRLSLFRGHSTDSYGFSRPNGKSGIPRVSLMLARNNSAMRTTSGVPVPSSSSQHKCDYCDKTFAKQTILGVHLLEKCEKIPPFRRRQLSRQ